MHALNYLLRVLVLGLICGTVLSLWDPPGRLAAGIKQPTFDGPQSLLRRTGPHSSIPHIAPCSLMPWASPAKLSGSFFAHVYLSCVSWSLKRIGGRPCVAAHAGEVGEKKGMAMRMLACTTRQDPTPCVPSLGLCAHQPKLTYPNISILLTALVVWCVRCTCLCQTTLKQKSNKGGRVERKKK